MPSVRNCAVPLFNIQAQYKELKQEIDSCITSVLDQGSFILGKRVESFEKAFASYNNSAHCVGVASGTDALELSFRALGIGIGDEVLIPAFTFVGTAHAIRAVGAKPVLVDIDPNTYLMDCSLIEAAINIRTKAVCPVHLFGRAQDMNLVMQIAKKHELFVIEDTAQAHGAKSSGQNVGSFADCGCFSFYPTKNLGSFGDAGAILCQSKEIAERLQVLRNQGAQGVSGDHDYGTNSRLDALQAAVLSVKLKYLDTWNARRRKFSKHYREILSTIPEIRLARYDDHTEHVQHLFTIEFDRRDDLQSYLFEQGIETGVYYRLPLHLQKSFTDQNYIKGDFPNSEAVAERILALPMYPHLDNETIDYVNNTILKYFR